MAIIAVFTGARSMSNEAVLAILIRQRVKKIRMNWADYCHVASMSIAKRGTRNRLGFGFWFDVCDVGPVIAMYDTRNCAD